MAIVLVAAALVIGLALLGTDLVGQDGLSRSDGQVAVTTARLHQVQRQVARSQADLDAASSDRRRVADALAGTRATLGSVQRSLTVAERDRFILGVNAGTLNNCLSGVEQALNRLSVGDSAGAVATLTSVSSSCHAVAAGT